MVTNLTERRFREKIMDYEEGKNAPLLTTHNTIIEFWVRWCPHCQALDLQYVYISKQFPKVDCYRIELEEHTELANVFGVASFPAFVFITKEGRIEKYVGKVEEKDLTNLVKNVLGV